MEGSDISSRVVHIAGILCAVYGLDEAGTAEEFACLWLLHPRGKTQAMMAAVAADAIKTWTDKRPASFSHRALIAVSFDQRNHGTRTVDESKNDSWKAGNPSHALDMFSIFCQ